MGPHTNQSKEQVTYSDQLRSQQIYKCSKCPSSFKRSENLKRHQRGHDGSKKFMCSVCSKSFARSDILGRHAAVHITHEPRNGCHYKKRACSECAKARERCSRDEPCRRCTAKSLLCFYPDDLPFKITTPTAPTVRTTAWGDHDGTVSGRFDTQNSLSTLSMDDSTSLQEQGTLGTGMDGPFAIRKSPSSIKSTSSYETSCVHPPNPHDIAFQPSIGSGSAPPVEKIHPLGASDSSSRAGVSMVASNTDLIEILKEYQQSLNSLGSKLASSCQPNSSVESKEQPSPDQVLNSRNPSNLLNILNTHSSDTDPRESFPSGLLSQSQTRDFSVGDKVYESPLRNPGTDALSLANCPQELQPIEPPREPFPAPIMTRNRDELLDGPKETESTPYLQEGSSFFNKLKHAAGTLDTHPNHINFDQQLSDYYHQTSHSRPINLKAYEFIAMSFKELCEEDRSKTLSFDAARLDQYDYFIRLYFEHFNHDSPDIGFRGYPGAGTRI
ncbi:hypothetical protein F5Y19DRAFT_470922 [Xylariaceae sp. FL1651]|nr:hypothetical protein F5Y19DRAFT_470922 [Xylariaceae sp. FL1651]